MNGSEWLHSKTKPLMKMSLRWCGSERGLSKFSKKRIEKKCKFADLSCLIWKQRTRHFVILQVIPAEERQNYNKGTTL